MRLRLSDPGLVPELLEFLQTRLSVVAEQVAPDEIEVSLLGSYGADGMRIVLDLLVRAWEAGRPGSAGSVELLD